MNENIVWHQTSVSRTERAEQKKQKPCILWFTGLSGSGKSTVANAVEKKLFEIGCHSYLLDGDNVRHGINKDLTFSDEDRIENIRRIGEISKLFIDSGLLVLTAFISPFQADRDLVRSLVADDEFVEVYIDTPIEVCEQRDPKGLYQKARKGEIKHFTGIDSPYEAPSNAEVVVKTADITVEQCAIQVVDYLKAQGYLNK
ncbi:adenylyl-sulfate kinase [Algibacillus agarilyticus]|uniref:adenylyl-sulfate kinase n=1 Tax=Algibacillus agarilyticus TaxID=2234133 RepID=UPI000DD0CEBB|nr:adenylyl-sulfate kinase [Algibacillus agarilyticus]